MACGTPAILGRLPAYAEVVTDGRTALLVDLRPEAIADGIERILQQPAWAQALAAAAQAAVGETASLSRAVERVDELYSRVRHASGHRTRTLARAADALSLLVR
jgi:glycosyltransferase involved in cell wall biosynthesis